MTIKNNVVPAACKLKNEEMESHLSFDLVDRKWNCWSTIKKDIAKMKRQNWTLIKTEYYSDGTVYSATYEAPENAITFRKIELNKPVKQKVERKPMSEEQKAKMKAGRAAKKLADAKEIA